MFTVAAAKGNFFNRKAVTDRLSEAKRKNLSKWGAYVRQDARTSIKYKDKPSAPGQPPSGHRTMRRTKTSKTGVMKVQSVSPLREFLFFAYDPSSDSVVAGPARLQGKIGNAPQALEQGGKSEIRSTVWRDGRRSLITSPASIRARPTMGPAAARTNKKLPEIWASTVK